MKTMIEAYLKEKDLAWANTTKKTVFSTLNGLIPYLTGDPLPLWEHLQTQKPYSRVTTWGRVCSFWDFVKPNEANPYRQFREKNKIQFRDKYVRRPANETIKSARKKIESITDPAIRRKALELLFTGMRWSESFTLKDGFILGKGGRGRQVFLPQIEGPEFKQHYRTFFRALEDVGLKPHSLRKIYLTECVDQGASLFELKAIAGWKSLESASSYIGVKQERLKQLTESIRKRSDPR